MPLLLPLNFIKRASRETGSNSLTTDQIEFSSFDAITELFQFLKLPVFSTNLPDYKSANIANFIVDVPLERNWTHEVCNLECNPITSTDIYM